MYTIVAITRPPESKKVCRSSDVTISCGYQWFTALPVTWMINGMSFTEIDSPSYRLNNPESTTNLSLTVFSINSTTTFQCIVHSTTNVTSTFGTITVTTGKYVQYIFVKLYSVAILWVNNYIQSIKDQYTGSLINYIYLLIESSPRMLLQCIKDNIILMLNTYIRTCICTYVKLNLRKPFIYLKNKF